MSLLCCFSSMASNGPDISLTLDSSATSFLNGQLLDDTRNPLYTIETVESVTRITSTQVQRDRRRGTRAVTNTVASIQWPQRHTFVSNKKCGVNMLPDASVTMNGTTTPARRLLRLRKLVLDGTSYKFRIDGYTPTFRWKRQAGQHNLYVSGLRQRLATLSCDVLTSTFMLEITGASIPSYHAQDRPGSVSSILLDHIVLTAMLLVTPPLEWRRECGATATRLTTTTTDSSFSEDHPPAFVYFSSAQSPSREQRAPRDPFDDCHGTAMRAVSLSSPISLTPVVQRNSESQDLSLRRHPSATSTASSRTLVHNLINTVFSAVHSDQTAMFESTTDVTDSRRTSYYGQSIESHNAPPPYQRA